MDGKPGFLSTLGATAVALFVFIVIACILSMIITVPLKLLRGCTLAQSIQPEPEAIYFGITAVIIIGIYAEMHSHYGPDTRDIGMLSTFAFVAGLKAIHSAYVILRNPNLGSVEVEGIVRH